MVTRRGRGRPKAQTFTERYGFCLDIVAVLGPIYPYRVWQIFRALTTRGGHLELDVVTINLYRAKRRGHVTARYEVADAEAGSWRGATRHVLYTVVPGAPPLKPARQQQIVDTLKYWQAHDPSKVPSWLHSSVLSVPRGLPDATFVATFSPLLTPPTAPATNTPAVSSASPTTASPTRDLLNSPVDSETGTPVSSTPPRPPRPPHDISPDH